MKNGTQIQDYDKCPVHNTPIRKQYDFGRYQDATVTTYNGCKCATCLKRDYINPATVQYYTNYELAASRAKMVKEQMRQFERL